MTTKVFRIAGAGLTGRTGSRGAATRRALGLASLPQSSPSPRWNSADARHLIDSARSDVVLALAERSREPYGAAGGSPSRGRFDVNRQVQAVFSRNSTSSGGLS